MRRNFIFSVGCLLLTLTPSARGQDDQLTSDFQYTNLNDNSYYDSQSNLLWDAYDSKLDSLLANFFNNWKLETQIAEEPLLDSRINVVTESLYDFLLSIDFQSSVYPYKYAVIQDRIESTIQSPISPSNDETYTLRNFHPLSSDPNHPIWIMMNERYNNMLYDFLGDWSKSRADSVRNFFGNYLPIGLDAAAFNGKNDWSIIRHWYSFVFSPALNEAIVSDQTPWGTDTYTVVVGPYGRWEKVQEGEPVSPPITDPITGPPVVGPPPSPLPPYYPVQTPLPSPIIVTTPAAPPTAPAERPARPRPTGDTRPNQPTSPSNPVSPIVRPRIINPPVYNPPPQNPIQPERRRDISPPVREPSPPQAERPRINPAAVNYPSSPKPSPMQPAVRPVPSERSGSPAPPPQPKPSPPPREQTNQDQKKDRQR